MKLAPSEVSRDSVQVVLRDSTSISPDCSAVKRSLADSGTNFTLAASLKIAAAIARQISTSRPAQLPLSSGAEKPGKPWLTPQDSMPRSLTVLRVCAVAACVERPAARTTVRARDTRFMGENLSGARTFALSSRARERPAERSGHPGGTPARVAGWQPIRLGDGSKFAASPSTCSDLNSSPASQNGWRAGSRG